MTVSSTVNRSGPYNGNGVTTTFVYGFRILGATHLTVVSTVDGVDTVVDPSDYSVSGVGDAGGGNIVFTLAPASDQAITIIRNTPFTQETDLENQGAYYAETVEAAFDLAAMRDQQLEERLDRAVQIPVGADPAELPTLIENVIRLSGSADNIDIVADNIDAVNTLAPHAEDITTNLADIHNFADVYQGAKPVDPTERNDSSPLQAGDLYFNTVVDLMKVYTGIEWRDAAAQSLNMVAGSFVGDGVETDFVLGTDPGVAANVIVWVGGTRQKPIDDYTVAGSTLSLITPPGNLVEIDTLIVSTVSTLNVPASGSVEPESIGDGMSVTFETATDVGAAVVPSYMSAIRTNGYAAGGDGGAAIYKRVVSEPAHPGKLQSADGAWWQIAENRLSLAAFGAQQGGPNCSTALENALDTSAAIGGMVYIPSGDWHFATTSVYPIAARGIVGEGDSSVLYLTSNVPLLTLTTSVAVSDKLFTDFKVLGGVLSGAYEDTRFLKVTGSGSIAYSRFRNIYFQSLYIGMEIDTDPISTAYGLESQSGFNKWENCTFWYGSRDMVYGILFKRGSSTGNTFPRCQAACAGAVLRYEGAGCVVGDIIYDGDHLGEGYIASFANNIVYNRSMSFESQVDAGSAGPLIFDAGQVVSPNNIKARGTFGGSQQWANVPPLRFSHIDDLGNSRWEAGGKIANSATSGLQSISLWDVELGSETGTDIEVIVEGLLGGVEVGFTRCRWYATRVSGNVRFTAEAVFQFVAGAGIPTGWPTLSAVVSGSHLIIQCAFTPNGAASRLNTNIYVKGGATRVFRVAGVVEL